MLKRKARYVVCPLLAAAILAGAMAGCAAPQSEAPVQSEPVAETQQTVAPVQSEPAVETPQNEAPVQSQPAEETPQGEVTIEPSPTVAVLQSALPTEPSPAATPLQSTSPVKPSPGVVADVTPVEGVVLVDEAVALSAAPAALPIRVSATAPGTLVKQNESAVIDYSNSKDGYVMVKFTAQSEQRLKAQVKGPTTTYTYNLPVQEWTVFPLSDGNGDYQVVVYQNVTESKYAAVLSLNLTVTLKDEFAPFLHSNQYVNYDAAPNAVAKAAALTQGLSDPLAKVEAVYSYVVKNLSYDQELAATVQSGYLPVLDKVLEKGTGICFDYAALMTGMLRSQGVPCKLVVGYAGSVYHAWINVWTESGGWVDGVIWFDGTSWQRMDPTFASSANSSESIMSYIGDGTNYSAKYFY